MFIKKDAEGKVPEDTQAQILPEDTCDVHTEDTQEEGILDKIFPNLRDNKDNQGQSEGHSHDGQNE